MTTWSVRRVLDDEYEYLMSDIPYKPSNILGYFGSISQVKMLSEKEANFYIDWLGDMCPKEEFEVVMFKVDSPMPLKILKNEKNLSRKEKEDTEENEE